VSQEWKGKSQRGMLVEASECWTKKEAPDAMWGRGKGRDGVGRGQRGSGKDCGKWWKQRSLKRDRPTFTRKGGGARRYRRKKDARRGENCGEWPDCACEIEGEKKTLLEGKLTRVLKNINGEDSMGTVSKRRWLSNHRVRDRGGNEKNSISEAGAS